MGFSIEKAGKALLLGSRRSDAGRDAEEETHTVNQLKTRLGRHRTVRQGWGATGWEGQVLFHRSVGGGLSEESTPSPALMTAARELAEGPASWAEGLAECCPRAPSLPGIPGTARKPARLEHRGRGQGKAVGDGPGRGPGATT